MKLYPADIHNKQTKDVTHLFQDVTHLFHVKIFSLQHQQRDCFVPKSFENAKY